MASLITRLRHVGSRVMVELHETLDIVCHPPYGHVDALLNPGNEEMNGTELPYFPMPKHDVPDELRNTNWGGMEAGPCMFYREQVVDGSVSALGGHAYRAKCRAVACDSRGERCAAGQAVLVEAAGALTGMFDSIIHTTPPLGPGMAADAWEQQLQRCYSSAFGVVEAQLRARHGGCGAPWRVASPLLGAGCRRLSGLDDAAAQAVAARCAAEACTRWDGAELTLAFGLTETRVAQTLLAALRDCAWEDDTSGNGDGKASESLPQT
eukprot:g2212.t1